MSKKIAIFNSFPFHYEMFGYIIYYCYLNKYNLTIYTEGAFHMGWFLFYQKLFTTYAINLIHYKNFEDGLKTNNYDLIFLTTDDDPYFDVRWMNDKVVCINHYYVCRRIDWFHRIATRPFCKNSISWAIPCIPVFNSINKLSNLSNDFMNVAIVGAGNSNNPYNISTINKLTSNKKIILHIITRNIRCDLSGINENIKIYKHESPSAEHIFSILLKCNYILTDINTRLMDHQEGISMSGSVPIAFSSLSKLIISKKNNMFYKFVSVKEYDLDKNENIFLEDTTEEMFKLVEQERNYLISMFHNNVNSIINIQLKKEFNNKRNTALIVEPRFLEIVPYIISEYYKILGSDWIIVFYCGKGFKSLWECMIKVVNIEIRELQVNNLTPLEYSDLFKQRQLWESLYGEFVLTFQTDSIIRNIEPYTIDSYIKLNKSYIGGNMCYEWRELLREKIDIKYKNLNGGLSLRKRVDMIKIINTLGVEFTEKNSLNMKTDPEDVYFTIGCYKLNLPIGDDEFCSHFSVHSIYYDTFFGVHSPTALPKKLLLKHHSDLEFFVKNFI
jgi:hypothetical protein